MAGFRPIKTLLAEEIVATNDLTVDCGALKTLALVEPVYDDFIPAVSVLATGSASPDVINVIVEGVAGSYFGFDGAATEERLTVKIELYHGYKEGSDIEIHVHSMPTTNNTGTCIWYFDYFYSPVNAAPVTGSTLSATATMTENQLGYDKTVSLGTIPGSGVKLGDFIIGTLRRTPLGDTYPDDMALKQIAAHCQLDTIGSRQRYAK